MSNLHKLFRELFNLSVEENYDLRECMELIHEAKTDFDNVGVDFTYERFVEYAKRRYGLIIAGSANTPYAGGYIRKLKIIEGDNLDKIEDAAKDKGLI
jgi:hypothetical protein